MRPAAENRMLLQSNVCRTVCNNLSFRDCHASERTCCNGGIARCNGVMKSRTGFYFLQLLFTVDCFELTGCEVQQILKAALSL